MADGYTCSNCGKFFTEKEMVETSGKIPHDCGAKPQVQIRIEDGRRK